MSRRVSFLPTLLLMTAARAWASHVVVPDDVPTVQQAVDGSADTVLVKDGLPPERVTVARSVVLEPTFNCTSYSVSGCFPGVVSSPTLQSLEVRGAPSNPNSVGCRVRGFRFLGTVTAQVGVGSMWIESCRVDSSMTLHGSIPDSRLFALRGCLCLGHVDVGSTYVQVVGNVFLAGLGSVGDALCEIRNNLVIGPADVGMSLDLEESGGPVVDNTVRNCTQGIVLTGGAMNAIGNVIEDCSGDGIHVLPTALEDQLLEENTIRRCGGVGIDVEGGPEAHLAHNLVQDTGSDGIRVTGQKEEFVADTNVVLGAGGVGMRAGCFSLLHGNAVGNCRSDGIYLTRGDVVVEQNTSFSNGGAGFRMETPYNEPLLRNIAAFNNGPGLAWLVPRAPTLACNDWFGNNGGNVVGATPDSTDLSVDPWFCDVAGGDVYLTKGSPLVSSPGCGQIGALGIGCGQNASVPSGGGIAKRVFLATPVPSRGSIEFEIPPSNGAQRLEVYDVTGARRWEASIPANSSRLEWDGHDSSSKAMAPGVYFGRLSRFGAPTEVTRIVLSH